MMTDWLIWENISISLVGIYKYTNIPTPTYITSLCSLLQDTSCSLGDRIDGVGMCPGDIIPTLANQ